jgi:hypothetical protein
MTPGRSEHEPIRFMDELVCEAIPAPSLARPKDADPKKDGEEPQIPPAEPENPKADNPRGDTPRA